MLSLQKILNRATTRRVLRYKIYDRLRSLQYSSQEEYEQRIRARLRFIVKHAIDTVPFYREIVARMSPSDKARLDLESCSDLQILPILTKDLIRDQRAMLYSESHSSRGSYSNTSGGTTGVPTQVLHDREYYEHAYAQTFLVRSWKGVDPFDSIIRIWGAQRDFGSRRVNIKLRDFFRNRIILNCFRMTESEMTSYLHVLSRHRPKLIQAYVTAIYELACHAEKNDISVILDAPIQTGAGTLHDAMRAKIETVFSTKVFNHYGARETGAIASQCGHSRGMHVLGDHSFVEVVDENGKPCAPGEEGSLLVTSLNNFSMPIIRYQIGDRAVAGDKDACACGRVYPMIAKVTGRQGSVIRAVDGALVDTNFFVHTIGVTEHHPGIRRFQVVQEALDQYTVRLLAISDIPSSVYDGIARRMREVLGENVSIRFEHTNELNETVTGKFEFVVSKL